MDASTTVTETPTMELRFKRQWSQGGTQTLQKVLQQRFLRSDGTDVWRAIPTVED